MQKSFFFQRIKQSHHPTFGHLDTIAVGNKIESFQPSNFRTPLSSELVPISSTKTLLALNLAVKSEKHNLIVSPSSSSENCELSIIQFNSSNVSSSTKNKRIVLESVEKSPKIIKLFFSNPSSDEEKYLILLVKEEEENNSKFSAIVIETKSLFDSARENDQDTIKPISVIPLVLEADEQNTIDGVVAAASNEFLAISTSSPSSNIQLYSFTPKDPQTMKIKKDLYKNETKEKRGEECVELVGEKLPIQLDHSYLLNVLEIEHFQNEEEENQDENDCFSPPLFLCFEKDMLISYHHHHHQQQNVLLIWDVDRARRDMKSSLLRSKIKIETEVLLSPLAMRKVHFAINDGITVEIFAISLLSPSEKIQIQIFYDISSSSSSSSGSHHLSWRKIGEWSTRLPFTVFSSSSSSQQSLLAPNFFSFSSSSSSSSIPQDFEKKLPPLKNVNVATIFTSFLASPEKDAEAWKEEGEETTSNANSEEEFVSIPEVQMFHVKLDVSILNEGRGESSSSVVVSSPKINKMEFEKIANYSIERNLKIVDQKEEENFMMIQPFFANCDQLNCLCIHNSSFLEIKSYAFAWGRRIQSSPLICRDQIKLMKFSPKGTFLYVEDASGNSYTMNY